MNNEEPTDFQQLVYITYQALANENIVREIAGLRNEVNQLRIENHKVFEKITNQAKEMPRLRDELHQLKINTHKLVDGMTEMLFLIRKISSND